MTLPKREGMLLCGCIMLLLLMVVVLQLFGSDATTTLLGGSSSSSSSSLSISFTAILESSSPTCTVYSCFLGENDDAKKETCCKAVVKVVSENHNDPSSSTIELREKCMLEMAQVPPSITSVENPHETAQFSWVVSKGSKSSTETPTTSRAEQHLWTIAADKDRLRKDSVQTTTPYHRTSNLKQSSTTITTKIDSHLGKDGGMHRLFHHRFSVSKTTTPATYFLYLTIPQGMFIDLDDPIEATTVGVDSNDDDASHSFAVTSKDSSFRARLHAATVCDIEQPSFVSGQHLLVWEIDGIESATPQDAAVVEFATKLHLRYPHPSAGLEQWIDLPSPLLFANSNETTQKQQEWGLEFAERVWVAAGSDEDHNWIMGMTISFCLIGVGIMLRDVSRVSLWDDV